MSGWLTPKHDPPFELTKKDVIALKAISLPLKPVLRIGFKEKVSGSVISKSNAHLWNDQMIKVEFIKISSADFRKCSEELALKTKSRLIEIHRNYAVLFRKHPNMTLKEIYQKFRS